jgi:hypothetical protein
MNTVRVYVVDYGWSNRLTIEVNDAVLSGTIGLHRWFEGIKEKYGAKLIKGNSYMDYDSVVYKLPAAVVHEIDAYNSREI